MADQATPTGISREPGGLCMTWSDGLRATLPVALLRRRCPCAHCVDEVSGKRRLDPDSVPEDLELRDMQPVGNYAYRILFGDGHDAGIFSVERLRSWCEEAEAR